MSFGTYATAKQMCRANNHRWAAIQLNEEQAAELYELMAAAPVFIETWGTAYGTKHAVLATILLNKAAAELSSQGDNWEAEEMEEHAEALTRFLRKVAGEQ